MISPGQASAPPERRRSRAIKVGPVTVGGDAPISVQSMTNTPTADAAATLAQVKALATAGADIVRVSCPDEPSTEALRTIVRDSPIPIVADIHFHYRRAIEAAEAGAACLRVNPGNIGGRERVGEVVRAARDHGCSIRIGVNAGSLERDLLERYHEPTAPAMVESAMRHAAMLEDQQFFDYKISAKASSVRLAVEAYRALAEATDAPLHLGITESGGRDTGSVRSAVGLGMLLADGIGDTIRVSLSADPVEEVRVGNEILKSLGLRHRGVTVIACPSCARQQFPVIDTVRRIEERLQHIAQPITVSIIGCVVNGPGEARTSDVGVTGGGRGVHQLYVDGEPHTRLQGDDFVEHVAQLVEERARVLEDHAAKA